MTIPRTIINDHLHTRPANTNDSFVHVSSRRRSHPMFENQQVLLTAIDPTRMDCFEHFQEFLSNDKYTARKLQPCSATEFSVLHVIDAGIEGIVLKCNQPQGKVPVALKLFFQSHPPSNATLWPLRTESLYYAACARKKAFFSDPTNTPPPLQRLSISRWMKEDDERKRFDVIRQEMMASPYENTEPEEVLSLLNGMQALGWVAFKPEAISEIKARLPRRYPLPRGDHVIMGIVKPFVQERGLSEDSLDRQTRTMCLMRGFQWRLTEYLTQNWRDGYLVDGGDVDTRRDTRNVHRRYLEKSWCSIFAQLVSALRESGGRGRKHSEG